MHILQINYSTYLYDNHFSNSLSSNLKFVFFFFKILIPLSSNQILQQIESPPLLALLLHLNYL